MELINQLDGFDSQENVKVIMATNREDALDAALLRPGRLDRKIHFGPPDQVGRLGIFKIHTRKMPLERNIRFNLLASKSAGLVAAEIRCICTEAGILAIRDGQKIVTEVNFIKSVDKICDQKKRKVGSRANYT